MFPGLFLDREDGEINVSGVENGAGVHGSRLDTLKSAGGKSLRGRGCGTRHAVWGFEADRAATTGRAGCMQAAASRPSDQRGGYESGWFRPEPP